jgi:hypothetical protein
MADVRHPGMLFGPSPPVEPRDREASKRALDELFSLTHQYRTSKAYYDLMQFVARFRFYAPFNAMLVHVQMPGATFVAPPYRWLRDYGRQVKPGARPLVILQPMGPVMFVFDVSETEGDPLPEEVEKPFEVRAGRIGCELDLTVENAKRDGVAVHTARVGSQRGGSIGVLRVPGKALEFREEPIPVRYELELDEAASRESRYAVLAHELAHLYCGHLGTPDDRWWPDRCILVKEVEEFEAESVAYMVCARRGIENRSAEYLADYVQKSGEVPPISLHAVMKAAGLIEDMGKRLLEARKPKRPT